MRRSDLTELHYITPIVNVPSIMQHGILSHQRARRLTHTSVAMTAIQERRARKQVPGGRRLHEYVNLYIHARNPMLYKRQAQNDQICILRVSTAVLDTQGTVVSDSNASSDYARFAAAPNGLSIVDRAMTFAVDWRDVDPIQCYRKKAAKCAEVLVPDRVAPEYVEGAYVANQRAEANLRAAIEGMAIRVEPNMFF